MKCRFRKAFHKYRKKKRWLEDVVKNHIKPYQLKAIEKIKVDIILWFLIPL